MAINHIFGRFDGRTVRPVVPWRIFFNTLFSDINLARECEAKCGSEMFQCLEDCGTNTECSSSCFRDQVVCVDACPCHTGRWSQTRTKMTRTLWKRRKISMLFHPCQGFPGTDMDLYCEYFVINNGLQSSGLKNSKYNFSLGYRWNFRRISFIFRLYIGMQTV